MSSDRPLVSPIAFNKVCAIRGHAAQKSLSTEHTHETAWGHGVRPAQAHLDVSDSGSEESDHGIIEIGAVGAIQLSESSQEKGKRHILKEIDVGANVQVKRIRILGVARLAGVALVELIADPLLVFDALIDDAVREEEKVAGEWQGPGGGNG